MTIHQNGKIPVIYKYLLYHSFIIINNRVRERTEIIKEV